MSGFKHAVVTLWVIHSVSEEAVRDVLTFVYDDDGNATSPFTEKYAFGWYDEDFAEYHHGYPLLDLVRGAAETWRTLDEQVLPYLPAEGSWNGLYVIDHREDESWWSEETRPIVSHDMKRIGDVLFRLIGTFPVVVKG